MRGKAIAAMALAALVLFTLLVQVPYSQGTLSTSNFYCAITNSYMNIGGCIAATVPLGMAGILLALVLVAVVYMVGELFPHTGLRGWYTNELKETAISAIILVSIFSVLAIVSSMAVSFTTFIPPSTATSPYDVLASNLAGVYTSVQDSYLAPQIAIANNLFYRFFGINEAVALWKSIRISLYLPVPIFIPVPPAGFTIGSIDSGVTENLYQVSTGILGPTTEPGSNFVIDAATNIVLPILVVLQMQYDLILTIALAGLGMLIPMGMVMRAIPLLRALGGMFIALGIGMAIVYPLLLLLFNMPVTAFLFPQYSQVAPTATCQTFQSLPVPLSGGGSVSGPSPLMCGLVHEVQDKTLVYQTGFLPSQYNVGSSVIDATGSFVIGFGAGLLAPFSVYPILNNVLSMPFLDLVAQFIMFVFDIVIGIIIVSDISRVLGGPASLTFGIGRLKLA